MILIIIFSFLLLISPFSSGHAVNIKTGEEAPDFSLNSIEGNPVSLTEFKDRITVLIYWRPDQQRSHMALKDGNYFSQTFKNQGIQIIGLIAQPDNREEILKIVEDNNLDFPILIDSEREVYSNYGIRVYPSTVVVGRDGKIAYSVPGHALNYRISLEAHLKYLLGEIDDEQLQNMISPHRESKDDSVLKAERTYNLALKFTETKLMDQAIDAAKKAIKIKPDIAKSYILLGFLFLVREETDDALEQFNRALALDPRSHDAKTGLGAVLILKGDTDRAIEVLAEASVANPYPVMTYYELGKAYELKGDKNKSIEMYKMALDKIINNRVLPSSITR